MAKPIWSIDMELTHLRYFVAVAEELHFGRAARRLHMAQPPLSQQIKKLEDELEVKLFNRTSRKVELTAAGRIFLADARDILERAKVSRQSMRELSRGARGILSLGFNEPAIHTFLSATVREFIRRYPDVKLSLRELETGEQLDALSTRGIHLGIMRPYGYDLSGFQTRRLWKENYVLALPNDHSFCACELIEPAMLRDEHFIMFPRSLNASLFDRIQATFQEAGFTPNIVQEAVSKQTTLALVESGLGVAIVPESNQQLAPQGVAFRTLAAHLPPVEIDAVWRRDISPQIVLNFLEIAGDYCPPARLTTGKRQGGGNGATTNRSELST
jgi:DNA-binding transcriptional LysR family regulator